MTFTFSHQEAPGQFENPPGSSALILQADLVRMSADRSAVAAHFPTRQGLGCHAGSVGVWDVPSGKLLWWQPEGAVLLTAQQQILVFHNTMGTAPDGGVAHRLVRYSWPRMTVLDDLLFGLPDCGIEDLVLSPSERLVLVWLNSGQSAQGYELFSLDGPVRRLGIGELFSLPPMYCPPMFSPNERLVACSPGTGGGFWMPDEEDWPSEEDWPDEITDEVLLPSHGGIATFGSLVVHDIAAGTRSTHLLQFDLPAGWVPRDPWNPRWKYGATSIEFLTDEAVRLHVPDGSPVEVELPALHQSVVLPTPSHLLPDDEHHS